MARKLSNVRKAVLKLPNLRKKVRGIPMTENKKIAVVPAEGNGAEQGATSVDKIRDILFGSQIKGYEAGPWRSSRSRPRSRARARRSRAT